MNNDQQKRAQTAAKEDMDIEHLGGNEYQVKGKYLVNPVKNTCECPDHDYRGYTCKHILRTALEIQLRNLPQPGGSDEVTKPNVLKPQYDNVPRVLKDLDQWVCWAMKRDEKESHEKDWTKVPVDANNGKFASSTDSETWTTFGQARKVDTDEHISTDGIGFVVHRDDALIGIDIDDCRDPETGELVEGVDDLISSIGSYTEISPSGTGLRVFVFGEWPIDKNQSDLIAGDGTSVEVYEWGRYLTVTGYHVEGTPTDIEWSDDTIDLFARIMDTTYAPDA